MESSHVGLDVLGFTRVYRGPHDPCVSDETVSAQNGLSFLKKVS